MSIGICKEMVEGTGFTSGFALPLLLRCARSEPLERFKLSFNILFKTPLGALNKMVEGTGFEPVYAHAGRFTVCCH